MGGLKLDAIFLALQYEDRMELLDKVKIYTIAALQERGRERTPVKQFKNKRGRK